MDRWIVFLTGLFLAVYQLIHHLLWNRLARKLDLQKPAQPLIELA